MDDELPENVLEQLRCNQCNCYLSVPPVYLSLTYENICGRCVLYYQQEQMEFPLWTRNVIYENVVQMFAFPCRYAKDGCPEKLRIDSMKAHEDSCLYY